MTAGSLFIMKKKHRRDEKTRHKVGENISLIFNFKSFSFRIHCFLPIDKRNTSTATEYWAEVMVKYFTIEKFITQ